MINESESLDDYSYEGTFSLKEYTQFENYKIINDNWFFRPFIGAKQECLPEDFYDSKILLNKVKNVQILRIFSFVINILLCISFVLIEFLYSSDKPHRFYSAQIGCFIGSVLCIGYHIYFLIIENRITTIKIDCFDEGTNTLYSYFDTASNWHLYVQIIVFCILASNSIVAFIIFRNSKEEEEKKEVLVKEQEIPKM